MNDEKEKIDELNLTTDNEVVEENSVATDNEQSAVDECAVLRLMLRDSRICKLIGLLGEGVETDDAIQESFDGWAKMKHFEKLPEELSENFDEVACESLSEFINSIRALDFNADVLAKLKRIVDYDSALSEADAEGYKRGRNEKIEFVKQRFHRVKDDGSAVDEESLLPNYSKKSVWDR